MLGREPYLCFGVLIDIFGRPWLPLYMMPACIGDRIPVRVGPTLQVSRIGYLFHSVHGNVLLWFRGRSVFYVWECIVDNHGPIILSDRVIRWRVQGTVWNFLLMRV